MTGLIKVIFPQAESVNVQLEGFTKDRIVELVQKAIIEAKPYHKNPGVLLKLLIEKFSFEAKEISAVQVSPYLVDTDVPVIVIDDFRQKIGLFTEGGVRKYQETIEDFAYDRAILQQFFVGTYQSDGWNLSADARPQYRFA